jgi:hypothetical protein
MVTPRLADVQCTRMQFRPGDRLLVRSRRPLDKEGFKKLHRMVQRWAGDHVEVLVIDLTKVEIELEQR